MGCLVKGFKSKRHCQPPTVMNLPFETDCCTVSQLIIYDLSTLLFIPSSSYCNATAKLRKYKFTFPLNANFC